MTGPAGPIADQAAPLRRMAASRPGRVTTVAPAASSDWRPARTVTVTSGKGGVGKTMVAVNLALALGELGLRVVLVDADLGMANVDVVLGMVPRYHVGHVIRGVCSLEQALWEGPKGVLVLPGASGLAELAALEEDRLNHLIGELRRLDRLADVVVVDTGAGIGPQVLALLHASPEVLVVATPEPTSITNAYGLIKTLVQEHPNGRAGVPRLLLAVNMGRTKEEGQRVVRRLQSVAGRFLGVEISMLGVVPYDRAVVATIAEQAPLLVRRPDSPAARAIRQLARRLMDLPEEPPRRGLSGIVSRMLQRMR
ncbi:MAG TPA: MinD/ParA family protein [Limnochordales bacterium]